MQRKLLIAATIALSSALIPVMANAETGTAAPTATSAPSAAPAPAAATVPTEMTKDAWLNAMSSALPEVVCKGFMDDASLSKRLGDLKISKDKCMGLIPEIATKCQGQIYSKIPAMINEKSAQTWGEALGECIGKSFAEQYLIK